MADPYLVRLSGLTPQGPSVPPAPGLPPGLPPVVVPPGTPGALAPLPPPPAPPRRATITPIPTRTLSEAEFNRIRDAVIESAPPTLKDEADFGRWFAPQFESALAAAEALPPQPEGSAFERLLSNFGAQVNPLEIVTGLYNSVKTPEAVTHTLEQMWAASQAEFGKARQAGAEGRPVEMLGHWAAGLIPAVGPAAAAAGEQIARGDVAGGVGTGAGLLTATLAPSAAVEAVSRLPAVPARLSVAPRLLTERTGPTAAADTAAVQAGLREGVPVPVDVATGLPVAAGARAVSERTLTGSLIGRSRAALRDRAMAAWQDRLATRQAPAAVTPEQAGTALTATTEQLADTLRRQAGTDYDRLRAIEADPSSALPTPVQRPAAEMAAWRAKTQASVGYVPEEAVVTELRAMAAELEHQPYVARTWTEAPRKSGNAAGGDYDIAPGAAGAPVYDDILQAAPGTSGMTRSEVLTSIREALDTGKFTNAARGALEVAQQRVVGRTGSLAGGRGTLGAGAGAAELAPMGLPVAIVDAKPQLQPMYDALHRQREMTPATMMGDKARAYLALETLLNGPDFAPLSVVDGALSDLKKFAYSGEGPATAGQAQLRRAVKALDDQVWASARRAGPEAVEALKSGRAAVTAEHAVREVLDQIRAEPVQAYRQVTKPADTAIKFLEELQQVAPAQMEQVGRAVFDDLNGLLPDAAAAAWNKLGPRTKRILFGSAEHQADLDAFFRLRKALAHNPNPSGSALVGTAIAEGGALVGGHPLYVAGIEILGGTVSAALNSPKLTKLLLEGIKLPQRSPRAAAAWQGRWARELKVAGIQGAMPHPGAVALPAAAEDQPADRAPAFTVGPYQVQEP